MLTYLILTVAELYISPLGISFVFKVAPPKYQGIMQGGWLGATALGNQLLSDWCYPVRINSYLDDMDCVCCSLYDFNVYNDFHVKMAGTCSEIKSCH